MTSDWIDLFEEELSITQTTALEVIIISDFNLDISTHVMYVVLSKLMGKSKKKIERH